jgi:putative (di)nucleoside polyphosphate hydrolase
MDVTRLPYRLCVGIMLFNREGMVFAAKRIDTELEAWQMPQGGIDEGESPEVAAHRELKEETGVTGATIIAESTDWHHYDIPAEMVPQLWGGQFRGQTQKWFLMRFDGSDSDININTPHPEFSEWRWVMPQELPMIIVPFKRALYHTIVNEFAPKMR